MLTESQMTKSGAKVRQNSLNGTFFNTFFVFFSTVCNTEITILQIDNLQFTFLETHSNEERTEKTTCQLQGLQHKPIKI